MPYPRTLRFGAHKKKHKTLSRSLSSVGKLHETKRGILMFKSVFAAAAAIATSASAAVAGPYVNIETNAGWVGDDYQAATTDLHVGYEDAIGENSSFYVQGGPAIVSVDGVDSETEFSGKAGVGVDVAEGLNVYTEIAFLTGEDDTNYAGKLGVKYSF